MVKNLFLALVLLASVVAYPTVVIENGGAVTITRNGGPVQTTQTQYTTAYNTGYGAQADYYTGYQDGYRAGYIAGSLNKPSLSNQCTYIQGSCYYYPNSYYSTNSYPYNNYLGTYGPNTYLPYGYNPYYPNSQVIY